MTGSLSLIAMVPGDKNKRHNLHLFCFYLQSGFEGSFILENLWILNLEACQVTQSHVENTSAAFLKWLLKTPS